MRVLIVYTRLYADCLGRALQGIARNAWTLLLPVGLMLAFGLGASLVAPLGIVGGILLSLLWAALASCYLYVLGEVVALSPVRLSELQRSLGVYLWAVVNVMFIFWVVSFLLTRVFSAGQLMGPLSVVAFIALNALPETLYQRGTYAGMASLSESLAFLQEHWVEWLLPNVLLAAGLWALLGGFGALPLPSWVVGLLAGALLHVAMVFRGHLFRELAGSSHRQRMFRYGERRR